MKWCCCAVVLCGLVGGFRGLKHRKPLFEELLVEGFEAGRATQKVTHTCCRCAGTDILIILATPY